MNLTWRKLLPWSLANVLVTGLVMMVLLMAGPPAEKVLASLAELTRIAVAVASLVGFGVLAVFLLKPTTHRRLVVTSSARFADMLGATPTRSMGA